MAAAGGGDPYFDEGMRGWIHATAIREFWRVSAWYDDPADLIQDGALCYCKCRARYVDRVVVPDIAEVGARRLAREVNLIVEGVLYRRARIRVLPEDRTGPRPRTICDGEGTPFRRLEAGRLLPQADPTDEHRRWFMALVQTTFTRYVKYTIAEHLRWGSEVPVSQLGRDDEPERDDPWGRLLPPQQEEASLFDLLQGAPAELQQLAVLLVGDGAEALGFDRTRLTRRVLSDGSVRVQRDRRRRTRETTNEYYCRLLGLDPAKVDIRRRLREFLRGEQATEMGRAARRQYTGM